MVFNKGILTHTLFALGFNAFAWGYEFYGVSHADPFLTLQGEKGFGNPVYNVSWHEVQFRLCCLYSSRVTNLRIDGERHEVLYA